MSTNSLDKMTNREIRKVALSCACNVFQHAGGDDKKKRVLDAAKEFERYISGDEAPVSVPAPIDRALLARALTHSMKWHRIGAKLQWPDYALADQLLSEMIKYLEGKTGIDDLKDHGLIPRSEGGVPCLWDGRFLDISSAKHVVVDGVVMKDVDGAVLKAPKFSPDNHLQDAAPKQPPKELTLREKFQRASGLSSGGTELLEKLIDERCATWRRHQV